MLAVLAMTTLSVLMTGLVLCVLIFALRRSAEVGALRRSEKYVQRTTQENGCDEVPKEDEPTPEEPKDDNPKQERGSVRRRRERKTKTVLTDVTKIVLCTKEHPEGLKAGSNQYAVFLTCTQCEHHMTWRLRDGMPPPRQSLGTLGGDMHGRWNKLCGAAGVRRA